MTKNQILDTIKYMIVKQAELNAKLDENWLNETWDFDLAAKVEAAELAEHLGYKWWKDKEPDWRQAQMEVVDIWHFVLSKIARTYQVKGSEYCVGEEARDKIHSLSVDTIWDANKEQTSTQSTTMALAWTKEFINAYTLEDSLTTLTRLGNKVGIPFHAVKLRYIAKATLNQFRWDNGYKEGDYKKLWYTGEGSKYDTANYHEDNQVLTSLVDEIEKGLILADWTDAPALKLEQLIYNTLTRVYKKMQGAVQPLTPAP